MSVPKRRQTSSRGKKRRIHQKLNSTKYSKCNQCGKPVLPHHACKFCGNYNGKKIIETNFDKNTKSKTASK